MNRKQMLDILEDAIYECSERDVFFTTEELELLLTTLQKEDLVVASTDCKCCGGCSNG